MTQSGGKQPIDRVIIDPAAQEALDALLAKERKRRTRHRFIRFLFVIMVLMTLPSVFALYCRHIIGTNYETIIVKKYPHFSEKMVRAAVITDRLHMKILEPLLVRSNSPEEIEFRKAVIELGLEVTGAAEQDAEKIRKMRFAVASGLEQNPELSKKGIAFAVYELPPAKVK